MNKVEYFTDLAKSIEKDERRMNDDTISRQDAIDALNGNFTVTGRENAETIRDYINGVDKRLRELPSAERLGRWEKDSDAAFYWKCSECGAYLFYRKEEYLLRDIDEPNYCPNCGSFNGKDNLNEKL